MRENPAAQPLSNEVRTTLRQALSSGSVIESLLRKSVPKHRAAIWYYLGGLAMIGFFVQIVTGIFLLVYFEPVNEVTMKSLDMIIHHAPFGWLVRSMHAWGASFAIFFSLIHMFSAFFMKSYRAPRSVLWVSGVLLFILLLGFGYTGYQLPELRGIDLRRLFALHVTVLPLLGMLLVIGHISLAALLGSSVPIGARVKSHTNFFPQFLYGELIVWLCGFVVLLLVAWIFPWEFNGAVSAPKSAVQIGIAPDWYLLFLDGLEKPVGSLAGGYIIAAAALFWAAVPYLDRKARMGQQSPVFTWIGILVLVSLVTLTALAYFSVNQELANRKTIDRSMVEGSSVTVGSSVDTVNRLRLYQHIRTDYYAATYCLQTQSESHRLCGSQLLFIISGRCRADLGSGRRYNYRWSSPVIA